jgi:hypothetical protein
MTTFGPTHYDVRPDVRRLVEAVASDTDTSWNTYTDHPAPYWLDDISVDFWDPTGRGVPIGSYRGWQVCRHLIRQSRLHLPICYIRWRGRIWHPNTPWYDFNPDGISHNDHVHVTFDLYSRIAKGYCPWRGY